MGRTSKFSFPMPRRKARLQQTDDQVKADKTEEPKLSKAERLLGTTNLPVNNRPHYALQQQNLPRKQASSITLTVYEPTIGDGLENTPPVPQIPQVSPFFQESQRFVEDKSLECRADPKAMMSDPASLTHEHGRIPSSNSLDGDDLQAFPQHNPCTHMDSSKVNPMRSEIEGRTSIDVLSQTRKPKTLSNAHSLFPPTKPSQPAPPSMMVTNSSQPFPNTCPSKWRPAKLDFSKLLSRPSNNAGYAIPNRDLISPTYAIQCYPSDVNCPPELQFPKSLRIDSERYRGPNNRAPFSVANIQPEPTGVIEPKSASSNQDPTRHSKHWFDGLLEAEDDFDDEFDDDLETSDVLQPSMLHSHVGCSASNGLSIRMVDQSSPVHPLSDRQSLDQGSAVRRLSWQKPYPRSIQASSMNDVSSKRASTITARHSLFQHRNVCSDQDVDNHGMLTDPIQTEVDDEHEFNLPDIRASIALSEVDEEDIELGQAQTFHIRPRPIENSQVGTIEVRKTPKRGRSPIVPPLADVAKLGTIPLQQTPEPTASRTNFAERLWPCPSNIGLEAISPPSALNNGLKPDMSSIQHQKNKPRLMAVTEEEEALLEMMRQKKAAMVSHSFAEGFKTALMSAPSSPTYESRTQKESKTIGVESLEPGSIQPVDGREHDTSKAESTSRGKPRVLEHRRESVSTRKSYRPRHHKPHSASTIQTINSQLQSYEASHHHSSSADPIFIRLSTISASPLLSDGVSSDSPSEESSHSAIPSPITPHALLDQGDVALPATYDSSCSESIDSISDLQGRHESPKAILDRNVMNYGSYIGSVTKSSGYQPYGIDCQVMIREAPKGGQSIHHERLLFGYDGRFHQQSPSSSTTLIDAPVSGGEAYYGHHGCCGGSDTRCSVAADVLAAWSDLGGWPDANIRGLYQV